MTRTPRPAFSTRTIALLVCVGLVAFLATLLLEAFGDFTPAARRTGANSHSVSAIGHFAFVELLRDAGMPVLVSGSRSSEKTGPNDVLIVAEPPTRAVGSGEINYMLQAHRVLFILPKWIGLPGDDNPDWIAQAILAPADEVGMVLSEVSDDAQLIRPGALGPRVTTIRELEPDITQPQLMRQGTIDPVVETANGILAGRSVRSGATVLVLSDPDIVSNHGLRNGDNAALALALVEQLRGPGGAVIIDETLHGFRTEPSLVRAFLTLPFVVTTILFVAAIAVLAWASTARFGAPHPEPEKHQTGKFTLIDNIAALLSFGGNHVEIVRRYQSHAVSSVAQTFHIPHHFSDVQRAEWLDRIGRSRNVTDSLASLQRQASALHRSRRPHDSDIVGFAARTYRWKQEMIHGPH